MKTITITFPDLDGNDLIKALAGDSDATEGKRAIADAIAGLADIDGPIDAHFAVGFITSSLGWPPTSETKPGYPVSDLLYAVDEHMGGNSYRLLDGRSSASVVREMSQALAGVVSVTEASPEVLLANIRDGALASANSAEHSDEALAKLSVAREAEEQRRTLVVSQVAMHIELLLENMGILSR